jgi:hypothetical protein
MFGEALNSITCPLNYGDLPDPQNMVVVVFRYKISVVDQPHGLLHPRMQACSTLICRVHLIQHRQCRFACCRKLIQQSRNRLLIKIPFGRRPVGEVGGCKRGLAFPDIGLSGPKSKANWRSNHFFVSMD